MHDRTLKNRTKARPHPGPLPRERENRSPRSWKNTFLGRRAVFDRKQTNAINATKTFDLSGTVQNPSLSLGERAGVRASVALTFRGAHDPGASIGGQRVRRPLLQGFENRVADSLALAPQLRIPETQFLDSKSLEEPGSFCIIGLSSRMAMLEPVEFNREPRLLAEKVQKVFPRGMLAAELVAAEPPVPQPPPHGFLGPSGLLPERSGESDVGHGAEPKTPTRDCKNGTRFALTPALSPGRGGSVGSACGTRRPRIVVRFLTEGQTTPQMQPGRSNFQEPSRSSPSPRGRGPG
jgi:hypothetical protein